MQLKPQGDLEFKPGERVYHVYRPKERLIVVGENGSKTKCSAPPFNNVYSFCTDDLRREEEPVEENKAFRPDDIVYRTDIPKESRVPLRVKYIPFSHHSHYACIDRSGRIETIKAEHLKAAKIEFVKAKDLNSGDWISEDGHFRVVHKVFDGRYTFVWSLRGSEKDSNLLRNEEFYSRINMDNERSPEVEQQQKYWMVHGIQGGAPNYKHFDEFSAEREAQRLATVNPGQRFCVLEVKKCFVAGGTQEVEVVEHNDIPF